MSKRGPDALLLSLAKKCVCPFKDVVCQKTIIRKSEFLRNGDLKKINESHKKLKSIFNKVLFKKDNFDLN